MTISLAFLDDHSDCKLYSIFYCHNLFLTFVLGLAFNNFTVFRENSTSPRIAAMWSSSGIQLAVKAISGVAELEINLPDEYKGKTKGLMGKLLN